jgi:hypothetical protein
VFSSATEDAMTSFTSHEPDALSRCRGIERSTKSWPGRFFATSRLNLALLNRRCGPLTDAATAQIQALPLEQLESLAVGAAFSAGVALLDFQGPADLAAWLAAHTTNCA